MDIAGKIYSKEEADNIYGLPLVSIPVPVTEFQSYIAKTTDALMFRFEDNKIYIADKKRNVLNETAKFPASSVFHWFSLSVINELIEKGAGDTVNIELRDKEIVSLTINSFTLELGAACPPLCL